MAETDEELSKRLDALSFEEIEVIMRNTKSESQALACRQAIVRAFDEREVLRAELDTLRKRVDELEEKAKAPQIFNVDKQETRDAIMDILMKLAPSTGCGFPQPELHLQFDNGEVVKRVVFLEGYGEMSPDDAEGLCFALYNMAKRARQG